MWGKLYSRLAVAAILVVNGWLCATCSATEINWINNKGVAWPSTWTVLSGINDPVNAGQPENDFVGDATDPGGYWAKDSQYVYFRMRVDLDKVELGPNPKPSFEDAMTLLIDRVGYGNEDGRPDFGFSWDSKSNDNTAHGLEMQVFGASQNGTWGGIRMDDFDGQSGQKGTNDINGAARTPTDGFVRTVDQQLTTSFGNTTFVDYAVSWNYLTSQSTNLGPNQTWRVTFGSIHAATDHNVISYDVAGGADLTSSVTIGWSGPIQTNGVPEPATWVLTSLGATGFLAFRRWRKKKEPEETSECETP